MLLLCDHELLAKSNQADGDFAIAISPQLIAAVTDTSNIYAITNVSKEKITQRIGIGSGSPWVHTEAKRKGKPKYRKDKLNSDYILKSVIPACKDANGDEGCY